MTLKSLYAVIKDRKQNLPSGSYTTSLFEAGHDRIIQKFGEEAIEVVIAAKNKDKESIKYEVADLTYHLMVLLAEMGITFEDIEEELEERKK